MTKAATGSFKSGNFEVSGGGMWFTPAKDVETQHVSFAQGKHAFLWQDSLTDALYALAQNKPNPAHDYGTLAVRVGIICRENQFPNPIKRTEAGTYYFDGNASVESIPRAHKALATAARSVLSHEQTLDAARPVVTPQSVSPMKSAEPVAAVAVVPVTADAAPLVAVALPERPAQLRQDVSPVAVAATAPATSA